MEIAALKVKQSAKWKLFRIDSLILELPLRKIINSKITRKYSSALLKDNYILFLPDLLISIKREWVGS